MLKPQKKRIDKKALKKDPLLDSVLKAQTFYEDNKNRLVYGAAGIIVVILLFIWISALNEETEMAAVSLLGKAQIEYENYNYTASRMFLNKLQAEYVGTDAQAQGTFLLANLNYNQGNYIQAQELYNEFIDAYSGSEILIASAYAGIGACAEADSQYIKAAENYTKAFTIVEDLPQASEYLYVAGINYLAAGETGKAASTFNQVIDLFPDSPRRYDAETKLILASAE